ncbi:hypothetical protein ABIE67_005001 [Streptomyces sp. V4I8]|uniref:ATP-binding protein n=1 Tax=Streptomyces sp. V4I8 TaxID=3156469 RepID=UPI003516D99D
MVSELVTNAYHHAPGPCLLDLEDSDGAVEISVRDTDPTPPPACPADPGRVGRHGLEITMAVPQLRGAARADGQAPQAAIVLADDPGGDPAARPL